VTPNAAGITPKRLHHVAIAVRDLDAGVAFYCGRLGLPLDRRARIEEQGVDVALLRLANCELELIQPLDNVNSIARFIERRGEGLHHLCFTTPDIRAEMIALAAKNVELLDAAPREGIAGLVCFMHPRAHAGVLVELVEVSP
jgi:methylmalonyl-CoA/ethylmalonyl-CoA epimerase